VAALHSARWVVTVITSLLSRFPHLRRSVTVAAHSLEAAIPVALHMIYPRRWYAMAVYFNRHSGMKQPRQSDATIAMEKTSVRRME